MNINDRRAAFLVGLLILSNIHDIVATLYILQSGPSVGMELNPLLSWLYTYGGVQAFLSFKLGLLAIASGTAWYNRERPWVLKTTTIVTSVYVWLAVVELASLILHWRTA